MASLGFKHNIIVYSKNYWCKRRIQDEGGDRLYFGPSDTFIGPWVTDSKRSSNDVSLITPKSILSSATSLMLETATVTFRKDKSANQGDLSFVMKGSNDNTPALYILLFWFARLHFIYKIFWIGARYGWKTTELVFCSWRGNLTN